jgi:hypothetical protein
MRFLLAAAVFFWAVKYHPYHAGEVGGLVGTWKQLSRVACGRTDVDMSLFFLGDTRQTLAQSHNVRRVLLPPLLGTEHFPFLRGIPTHTDLAPVHPTLFRQLRGFQVLHTTDTFYAFANTALWQARCRHLPLVTSVQTDVIGWARIHTPAICQRLLGRVLTHWLLDTCGFGTSATCHGTALWPLYTAMSGRVRVAPARSGAGATLGPRHAVSFSAPGA